MQYSLPSTLKRINLLFIFATLLIVPFASFPHTQTDSTIIDSKFLAIKVLLGVSIITGIVLLLSQYSLVKEKLKIHWFDITFSIYGIITIYSLFSSNNINHAINKGIVYWLLFGLYWLIQFNIHDLRIIRKITWFMIGVGCLISLNMGLNFIGIYPLQVFYPYEKYQLINRGIFVSVLGNPEFTGCFLTPLSIFCLAGMFNRKLSMRIIWILLFIFLAVFSILTQSRAVIIGLTGGLIGTFIFSNQLNIRSSLSLKNLFFVFLSILLFATLLLSVFSTSNFLNPQKRINLYPRIISLFDPEVLLSDPRMIQNIIGSEMMKENYLLGSGFGAVEKNYFSTLGKLANEEQG